MRNEYHYVITLQFDRAGGLATQTTTGIVTAGEGSTREGLYRDVYKADRPGYREEWRP